MNHNNKDTGTAYNQYTTLIAHILIIKSQMLFNNDILSMSFYMYHEF
jgi:hypothetical protein